MGVRDHGAHSASRRDIEPLQTDISLTEEAFFSFILSHLIPVWDMDLAVTGEMAPGQMVF
jgi:hypothetical protein